MDRTMEKIGSKDDGRRGEVGWWEQLEWKKVGQVGGKPARTIKKVEDQVGGRTVEKVGTEGRQVGGRT